MGPLEFIIDWTSQQIIYFLMIVGTMFHSKTNELKTNENGAEKIIVLTKTGQGTLASWWRKHKLIQMKNSLLPPYFTHLVPNNVGDT